MEEIKRMAPTVRTTRELYLRSGNLCAMPDCHKPLLKDGVFIGEICHIEAAEKDGPRFNNQMTNEERRSFDNLILLCANCHKRIDSDITTYTVSELKKIKDNHESKYADIVSQIRGSIEDLSEDSEAVEVKNCRRINSILDWNLTDEELAPICSEFNFYLKKVRQLPLETRIVYSIIMKYSVCDSRDDHLSISIAEVEKRTNRAPEFVNAHLDILSKYELASGPCLDEENPYRTYYIKLIEPSKEWNPLKDIQVFLLREKIDFLTVFYDLDFSCFDQLDN